MKIKKTVLSVLLLNFTVVRGASENDDMEHEKIKKIEDRNKDYLRFWGSEDLPLDLKSTSHEVQLSFERKGWLPSNSVLLFKQISTNGYTQYANIYSNRLWNSAFTNGENIVHVDARPENYQCLNKEEQSNLIAHELAHIALHTDLKNIDPHFLMSKLHTGVNFAACTFPLLSLSFLIRLQSQSAAKRILFGRKVVTAQFLLIAAAYKLGVSCQKDDNRLTYPFLNKAEEVVCDVIAARAFSGGASAGASLHDKKLNYTGINRTSSDHPLRTTRINYYKFLAWFEKFLPINEQSKKCSK